MDEKKIEKKKAIQKRNKRDWLHFKFRDAIQHEHERIEQNAAAMQPASAPPAQDAISSRLDAIRSKNTGRIIASRERWNRFATTGDSGGRGL